MTATVIAVVVAAAGGAWLGPHLLPGKSLALPRRAERALRNTRALEGRSGPWGRLEYSPIAISIPDDYAPSIPVAQPLRWWFRDMSREDVESLFQGAGLTPEQLRMLRGAEWEVSGKGVVLNPPTQVVTELSPASRARIYKVLSRTEQNLMQFDPEVFYPEYMEERFGSSGLSDSTIGLVRKLLYPRGSVSLFSDSALVLSALPSDEERTRFRRMVNRKTTFLVQLVVDQTSDIDALVAYWDFPGRHKGLRPLFESLARLPGGGELDMAHLLPPFARQRLYTFPDDPGDQPLQIRECTWTALNFFNESPDDRFTNPEYTRTFVEQHYETVGSPRFGDLVVLTDETSVSHHFAVYVADDLAFTKNGFARIQPWILMKVPDLVRLYSIDLPAPLEVTYYRRKS